jgi:uncharacterized membrane protein
VPPHPLDLTATPERLHALAEAGILSPSALERAFRLAVASPARPSWRRFLSAVLLGFGSLLLLSGVIYFFAYNWAALHRFGKLGLLLGAILAACVAAWHLGEGLAGQFALLFAAVLVGPLLAVYGQAYQTGADPYELFLGWSLLVLPWVALARFGPLWLLLILLVDTALFLYWVQILSGEGTTLVVVLALVNGGAWALHELLATHGAPWLSGRWLPRVLALMTMLPLLALGEYAVALPRKADASSGLALALLVVVMVLVYLFHYMVRSELFLLTLNAVCLMMLVTTFIGRVLLDPFDLDPALVFFTIALLIIGEVGLTVRWLRAEARDSEEV